MRLTQVPISCRPSGVIVRIEPVLDAHHFDLEADNECCDDDDDDGGGGGDYDDNDIYDEDDL